MTAITKLRVLTLDDLDNMMGWVNDSEVTKNLAGFKETITREQEKDYLEKIIQSKNDKVYAMESSKGDYIGNIGLYNIYWPAKNGRIGIVIKKEYQKKGYAKSAFNEILNLAFNELNIHKVWGIAWEENKKTKHLFKKLGFSEEGILKDEYFHKGIYHNMVRFAILENEYKKGVKQ